MFFAFEVLPEDEFEDPAEEAERPVPHYEDETQPAD